MKPAYTISLSPESQSPVHVVLQAPGTEPVSITLQPGQEFSPLFKEKKR